MANGTCTCTVPCGCPAEQDQERNAFAIKIPALLGILATHSLDKPVPGLKNLMTETYPRLQRGRMARLLMQEISQGNREPHVLQAFRELEGDLGYGMLLSAMRRI